MLPDRHERWLYMPNLVMDGNFKIEHSKPRRPKDDVNLTEGTGMMTAERRYSAHLKVAKVHKKVGDSSAEYLGY